MKNIIPVIFIYILSVSAFAGPEKLIDIKGTPMTAKGQFEVNLEPQADADAPAGRMVIDKKYSGDLVGQGVGQMISKRTGNGTAAYSAIEEFEGSLDGKKGSFTLIHNGFMSPQIQELEVKILEGSGDGELESISGSLTIEQKGGEHFYVLDYEL